MNNPLRRALRSMLLYPTSTVYVAGVVVAVGVSTGWFGLNVGLVCLTAIAVVVVLVGLVREVQIVHHLVNSQRDELLNRISDLVETLQDAGIALPSREGIRPKDSK